MESEPIQVSRHEHSFGQHHARVGERRTIVVIAITATMMVVEIVAGLAFGSMALLADGLHMASHTAALGITAIAYVYARRHAHDERFSFGTGKVNALGGYTGAVLLAVFALAMASESVRRIFNPVEIAFDYAILVAVVGLAVNAASAIILGRRHEGHADHHHAAHGAHHQDHNLRAAYLHVLADALTSLTAIVALMAGKLWGLNWMDPFMGIVGSVLVARWSWGLLRDTSRVILDRQAPSALRDEIRHAIEGVDGTEVVDLHVWSIGPGIYSVIISVVTEEPLAPGDYRGLLPEGKGLVHATVEVNRAGVVARKEPESRE